ncbi:MAG: hypothetical protein II155_02655, partial [Clostridia bacterium]|nr:hypothetical protein [Clostridia bacterium]
MKKIKKFAAVVIIALLALTVCGAVFAEEGVPTIGAEAPKGPSGYIWAAIAVCVAMILPGIGSALGVGMAGRAAAGVSAEDPEKGG